MKEFVYYQCERCFAIHRTMEAAKACEEKHVLPVAIAACCYDKGKMYPELVDIELHNGKYARYVFAFSMERKGEPTFADLINKINQEAPKDAGNS